MTGHHSWHTLLIKAVIGSAQVQGDGEIGTLSEFVAIFPVYNLCLLISRKGEAANWELGWDQDGGGTRDSIRHILAVVAPQVSFTSLKFHSVWTTALLISSPFLYITLRRRQWHPTPVVLPGESHWRRSLVGWGPWGCEESDTTEQLHFHFPFSCIGEGNGNPLQCSCLENPRDGGAWWAAVHRIAQSRTRLKRLSSSSSSNWRGNTFVWPVNHKSLLSVLLCTWCFILPRSRVRGTRVCTAL